MPTYAYKCRKCGYQFDEFQSISAPPRKTCPKCKGRVARMLTTGAGIIFKGSGFYQTDYKKTSAPRSSKSMETKSDSKASHADKPAKSAGKGD